ncbi:site-specific integrase [Hydrogenophaga sp.]|uniref:site-specific integrase n=1 Tax=Hydrogenophaga sp. TaxID=1904254 RepID=UPI00345B8CEB
MHWCNACWRWTPGTWRCATRNASPPGWTRWCPSRCDRVRRCVGHRSRGVQRSTLARRISSVTTFFQAATRDSVTVEAWAAMLMARWAAPWVAGSAQPMPKPSLTTVP